MKVTEEALLDKMNRDRKGIFRLRLHVMGAAGDKYRREFTAAENLVNKGLAEWANPPRTLLRITDEGTRSITPLTVDTLGT